MNFTIEKILKKKTLSTADKTVLENYEPIEDQNRLFSFFSPIWLCQVMYDLAKRYGFKKSGKVLEPSCGSGNFLTVLEHPENATAF